MYKPLSCISAHPRPNTLPPLPQCISSSPPVCRPVGLHTEWHLISNNDEGVTASPAYQPVDHEHSNNRQELSLAAALNFLSFKQQVSRYKIPSNVSSSVYHIHPTTRVYKTVVLYKLWVYKFIQDFTVPVNLPCEGQSLSSLLLLELEMQWLSLS